MQSRRNFIKASVLAAAGLSVLPSLNAETLFFSDNEKLKKRAAKIHSKILTLDSHCDTPLSILYDNVDMGVKNDPKATGSKVDFVRMKEGGLDASFFAVFLGQGKRDDESNAKAKKKALEIFDSIHQTVNKYPHLAEIALNPSDAYRIQKIGKRAIYLGVENGYPVGNEINNLKEFYDLGARYITLCHTKNNDICDSSTDEKGAEHEGLSAFGEKVVQEMNHLGMMVDVSHISDQSFYDVIKLSKTPIIASHSSARAVCNHPRNMDDEMLKALANKGGVIQLCILNSYIRTQPANPERDEAFKKLREKYKNFTDLSEEERANASREWHQIHIDFPEELATVSDAVDHIDHMVKVAGIDHVGIGTDFDGGGGISGFYDISEAGNITFELVKRGYSANDIEKIWAGNFMRVFKEVQKFATI
ncbi:MAG: dipeptidase [Bacteroidales bacterium]|nr:dipeptidase [Bacteroidales bacterium]